jgi:hypothetical protein
LSPQNARKEGTKLKIFRERNDFCPHFAPGGIRQCMMIKSQINSRGKIANNSTIGLKSYGQIPNQIANILLKSQIT